MMQMLIKSNSLKRHRKSDSGEDQKQCFKCNEWKSVLVYTKNKRNKDNLESKCKECSKKHYSQNKKSNLESQKKWRQQNKEYSKKWYEKNKNQLVVYHKDYYIKNKEMYMKNKREWRKNNPHKAYLEGIKYRKNNKQKINEYAREWKKQKRNDDPTYKLKENLSRRLRYEITKEHSTKFLLSNSIENVKIYIESKFEIGMSWENYGLSWEIDHIIPCSSWNLDNKIDNFLCWHYKNLQPLWKFENRTKKDNYEEINKDKYMIKMMTIKF